MTNQQRIEAYLGFAPANSNTIVAALADVGLTAGDDYTSEDLIAGKMAALNVARILLTTADTVNENGYAIKFDRNALLKLIGIWENELGLVLTPTITAPRVW